MAGWVIKYVSDEYEEQYGGATREWHERGFVRAGEVSDADDGRSDCDIVEDLSEATVFESKAAADAFIDANTDRHSLNCHPLEQWSDLSEEFEPIGWHDGEWYFVAVEEEAK